MGKIAADFAVAVDLIYLGDVKAALPSPSLATSTSFGDGGTTLAAST